MKKQTFWNINVNPGTEFGYTVTVSIPAEYGIYKHGQRKVLELASRRPDLFDGPHDWCGAGLELVWDGHGEPLYSDRRTLKKEAVELSDTQTTDK